MAVIDMKAIRYINLLDIVSRVKTKRVFLHNNTIFFAVRKQDISRAIGPGAANVRKIQEKIGKKVKIIKDAEGPSDAKEFIGDIVSPVRVKSVEVGEEKITITAGSNQNKAALIGRNKRRFDELKKILQDYFHRGLKVI